MSISAAGGEASREPKRANILALITESLAFKLFILGCIVVNAAMIGYDAHFGANNQYAREIARWNEIFLWLFTAELALEFLAQGWRRYWRNGWNWFDVIIVGLSWATLLPGATAVRALRVVRVFRLVSNVPQMQRMVEALARAIPGLFATVSILIIVYYIAAVMATTMYGERFPAMFGDLARSGAILFQLTLFDDWGQTVSEVGAVYPGAWAFFLGFTVLSAFAVLNLFIGVIVDAVQEARSMEAAAQSEAIKRDVKAIGRDVDKIEGEVGGLAHAQEDAIALQQHILAELRALRAEVNALRASAPEG